MPSPFPGMDPYLEGYLWPDVHSALANKLRQQLAPKLRPNYTARLDVYTVEDSNPEAEVGIMYPDVEIFRQGQAVPSQPSSPPAPGSTAVVAAPLTLSVLQPVRVEITRIEIRDTAGNLLVTCIEILSPVNKREPNLTLYRRKCQRLYRAGVHLLEIDLLRRGTRPYNHPRLPSVAYLIALTRAQSGIVELWPLALVDPLPTVPVPLRSPDPDISLDLSLALESIYEEAAYDLSINYQQSPPPPALSSAETEWLQAQISKL